MPSFQVAPVTVEAVQFTGENWAEMHEFTGHRFDNEIDRHPIDIFNGIGTFLPKDMFPDAEGEIWVAAANRWMPVSKDDWIVQGPTGFSPWTPGIFAKSFLEIAEAPVEEWKDAEPTEPGFYYNHGAAQVMIYLLHKHDGLEDVLEPENQWYAIIDNTTMEKCHWGYIEQTIGAYPLRRVGT